MDTSIRVSLEEMGHSQPPTPVATYNSAENIILNGTENKIKSRAIDMRFYWVSDRIRHNHFHILWEKEKKPGGLCHKTPPNMATQNYVSNIFEKKEDI